MARVKIKCKGKTGNEKKKLLEILCSNQIHVTKVFTTPDGFALLLLNDEHADSIFTMKIKEILEKNDFIPVLPPELKVKKSVIVTKLDDLIYERNESEIKDELSRSNSWIGEEVDNVFKFPNSPTIKITFTQSNFAKKCTEQGLLLFNLSVPQFDIKLETFIPIKCCMKCYELETHATKECPKPKEFKICSNCSTEGHLWFECKEIIKCCLNCGEDHSTLAMKCTKRKAIIKEKRKAEAERSKVTYLGAAKTLTQTHHMTNSYQHHITPLITREEALKINICVSHAHYKNMESPGSYAEELNKILTLNNLPNIVVPATNTHSKPTHPTTQTINAPETKPRRIRERRDTERKEIEGAASLNNEIEQMEEQLLPKKDKEIGLQVFTPESRGWPRKNFTLEELVRGFNNQTYKYTYTDSKYTEEQVMDMIRNGDITMHTCWNIVGSDAFRKIRSGLEKERSPLNDRDPRARKYSHNN